MRFLAPALVLTALVLAPTLAEAAARVRLIDAPATDTTYDLALDRGPARDVRVDDGGGAGEPKDWIFQGCASIGTGALASIGVSLVAALSFVGVTLLTNPADPNNASALATATLVSAFAGGVLIPFATSAVVTSFARGIGSPAPYWTTVGASMVARLAWAAVLMLLPQAVRPEMSFGGAVVGAVVEVAVANFMTEPGAAGDVPVHPPLRALSDAAPRTEVRAAAVPMLAAAF